MSIGHFGDEDVVGGDGDPGEAGDPAGVAAHGLDDHDAAVALGGGPEAVDGLGHDVDRGVEAEGEVGDHQVVVDGLGDADDRHAELFVEAVGDAEGVVAADGDEGVEAEVLEVLADGGQVGVGVLEGVGAGGAEDRAAPGDDAVGLGRRRAGRSCSWTSPRQPSRMPTQRAAGVADPLDDGPDHRVEAGAVAAAGQ